LERLRDEDLAVALVVDPSLSDERLLTARSAGAGMLVALPPPVRSAVVSAASEPAVLAAATTDVSTTVGALEDLRPSDGSALRDSVVSALDALAETRASRRAVVVLVGEGP